MGTNPAALSKPFRYDQVQVHFIFSFCLAKDGEPLYPRDFERILAQPKWVQETPPDRQHAISPFLALKLTRAYKQVDFGTAEVAGQHVKLSALFRLFGIGGTFTVSMTLDRSKAEQLEMSDTYGLLKVLEMSAATRNTVTPIRCQQRVYPSVFDLFRDTLLEECKFLRDGTGASIHAHDFHEKLVEETAGQSPWLVTVFLVSGEEATAFCTGIDAERTLTSEEKSQRILPYYHAIGPVLFRSVNGESFPVEPTYRGRDSGLKAAESGTLLSNMHLDARMFVCSSRRNVVCIASNLEDEPATYFLPGILSINEGVRARWHALIVLNRSLDRILDRYGETVDVGESIPEGADKIVESRRATEVDLLKDIVRSRSWIGRVLDDPGIYTISGDALAALYHRGKDVFSLDELKRLLLEKADLVDRLHAYEQQLSWRRR